MRIFASSHYPTLSQPPKLQLELVPRTSSGLDRGPRLGGRGQRLLLRRVERTLHVQPGVPPGLSAKVLCDFALWAPNRPSAKATPGVQALRHGAVSGKVVCVRFSYSWAPLLLFL